jgi:uncharacterized cupin superfamily protein
MSDWFVVNVVDAPALRHEVGGVAVLFEPQDDRFAEFGINLRVLEPGQPSSVYHAENVQEDFLVLSGECLAIIEGEERLLRAWDFVHCPADTAHLFVGAGNGPCAILMIGARGPDKAIRYPANELAGRHGASATQDTDSAAEAYAEWGANFTPATVDWPPS